MVCEHSDRPALFQCRELVFQVLWNEQCFEGPLATLDGRQLQVYSPGTWNVEAGPDFKDARISLAGEMLSGDVEVHRRQADWFHHGHDRDPNYEAVVLHVVFENPGLTPDPRLPPCFVLEDCLRSSVDDLLQAIRVESYPYARRVGPGVCAVQWALLNGKRVKTLLRAAGLARFREKAEQLQQSMGMVGAGQAVYERLFEGLGYKMNSQPFRILSTMAPLERLRGLNSLAERRALLFGMGGLLADPSLSGYAAPDRALLRSAWDSWWKMSEDALDLDWARVRSRPANRPERRLYAGLKLLEKSAWQPDGWLLALAGQANAARDLLRLLREQLQVEADGQTAAFCGGCLEGMLLGRSRADDLIVNVVLPFLVVVARLERDRALAEMAEETYLLVPKLQGNRVLTEAIHRLLMPPSRSREVVSRACEQQGVMEIYRDFCLKLGGVCKNCPLAFGLPVANPPSGS
jgi:hypothetical protein